MATDEIVEQLAHNAQVERDRQISHNADFHNIFGQLDVFGADVRSVRIFGINALDRSQQLQQRLRIGKKIVFGCDLKK